jgi:hypothetical protein
MTRPVDPALDRVDELRPGESHEVRHRFVGRRRMAGSGEPLRDVSVADRFAVDQDAVEVEQQRVERHAATPRAPNSALPMRT